MGVYALLLIEPFTVTYIQTMYNIFFSIVKEFDGPIIPEVRPSFRNFTTLCPLINPEMVGVQLGPSLPPLEQKMLLLWGKRHQNEIVADSWIFDMEQSTWSQVRQWKL